MALNVNMIETLAWARGSPGLSLEKLKVPQRGGRRDGRGEPCVQGSAALSPPACCRPGARTCPVQRPGLEAPEALPREAASSKARNSSTPHYRSSNSSPRAGVAQTTQWNFRGWGGRDHVRGSRDSARKKKFARRGPNDLSEPCASLPGPGLSEGAQADLSEGGFSLRAFVSLGSRRSPTPTCL
ncbi:Hypothetical predicted protein [Lynx pardinus]|uniref:Uncharacterized protein n=1 Tax=Lynx pardinus TaxID=191816 RepID=A0A485MM22_LYNPA|nr:Hypothetical predicted protein [Lynx pardinus]